MERDSTGFEVFSAGNIGRAHVMAHRLLDTGAYEAGHRWLGAFLDGRRGAGSDWLHIQWHMVVFELAVGEWSEGLARYREHLAPAAAGDSALTDVPSALWRLTLSGPGLDVSAWRDAHTAATRELSREHGPYVVAHHLLALAGAGDASGLSAFIDGRTEDDVLSRLAAGLRAFALGHWDDAAHALGVVASEIGTIGGSRAQNELFADIGRAAAERATAVAA